VWDW